MADACKHLNAEQQTNGLSHLGPVVLGHHGQDHIGIIIFSQGVCLCPAYQLLAASCKQAHIL